MKPPPFAYHRPATVEDAVGLLGSLDDAKLLAGGQSLVPLMNLRLARPEHLVDLNPVAELEAIGLDSDRLLLGALVRHSRLLTDPLVATHVPLLAEAARHIAHTAIRNRGTVGGSLAHADPAAELPSVMVALDATVIVAGPGGERTLPVDELFVGPLQTSLGDDELIVGIAVPLVPTLRAPGGWGFAELARRRGDFATVLAARAGDRVALGGVGPAPVLTTTDPVAAMAACSPTADVHASAEYRRAMVGVLVERVRDRGER